ncbi:MAG: cell division ATP-binding protein FtsE, partial [Candidatus Levybacteria bacterium]|nr:cell division ATP-binding protein FtsE [Candidatus Levybacteria bacterium]
MISLQNVSKKFGTGVFALSDISFDIEKGEFVFLVGPTGSGKTTILRTLIRDLLPTKGTIIIDNWDILKLPQSKIPDLRKKVGIIFQDLKLLSDRTILENISLPLEVTGMKAEEAKKRVEEILSQVGIIQHKDKFPVQLSGGELQRVAIARALILSPDILLADEPTGNLDPATSWEIVKLLADINEKGTTIVMATHNADIIKSMSKRIIELHNGTLVKDTKDKHKHKSSDAKAVEDKEKDKDKKEEKAASVASDA